MWIEGFVAQILYPNGIVRNLEMGLEVVVGQLDYRCPSWIELVVLSVRRFCPLRRIPSSAFLDGGSSYYTFREAMYCLSCYALCTVGPFQLLCSMRSGVLFELLCSCEAVYCSLRRILLSTFFNDVRSAMLFAKRFGIVRAV